MESKQGRKSVILLPRYFKKIGLLVMLFIIALAIAFKAMQVTLLPAQKELMRISVFNSFILALLFVACSKDKVEDQMTMFIRLKTMAAAFISLSIYVIVSPYIKLLANEQISDLSAQSGVTSMLLFYIIFYYLQKRGR